MEPDGSIVAARGTDIVRNEAYRTWLTASSNCRRNGSVRIPPTAKSVDRRTRSMIGPAELEIGMERVSHV